MPNIMQTFIPWEEFPCLTLDRLKPLASAIKTARDSVVPLHDVEMGDNNWSKHCHGYTRQNHAIRALAKTTDWLEVSSQNSNNLEFSFRVGEVPLKIVRGDPEDPIYRHQDFSMGEQILMVSIMGQLPSNPFRLVASTDEGGHVTDVHLVEFDGPSPIRSYQIPLDDTGTFILPTPDPVAPTPVESHDQSSDQQNSASA